MHSGKTDESILRYYRIDFYLSKKQKKKCTQEKQDNRVNIVINAWIAMLDILSGYHDLFMGGLFFTK